MADSLSPQCTPLKKEYDTCFNAWFEGYLEPAVSASASPQKQAEYSQRKAEEFQQKCGKIWESYRGCVQASPDYCIGLSYTYGDGNLKNALNEKGLDKLLDQSRSENPLTEPPTTTPSQTSS